MQYIVSKTKEEAAGLLAKKVIEIIVNNKNKLTHIGLSGGSTPFIMFELWAKNYKNINWNKVHFWWVDERCVPPSNDESNYGNTKKVLFDHIDIPAENIHRVKGENEQEQEVERYSNELKAFVPNVSSYPLFDIILLGMGDDGHTASIFPHQMELLSKEQAVVSAHNPYSGQKRISLSGKTINNAQNVFFLVTGDNKAPILNAIFSKTANYLNYPSAHIKPEAIWYLDSDAAQGL